MAERVLYYIETGGKFKVPIVIDKNNELRLPKEALDWFKRHAA